MNPSTDEISPESSVECALKTIEDLESAGKIYRTIGISYGCFVSLACAAQAASTCLWDRAVLWGPIPYWKAWESLSQERTRVGQGTRLTDPERFLFRMKPVEYLLQKVPVQVTIAVGGNDVYVSKIDLDYFQSFIPPSCGPAEFVPGVGHNPLPTDPGIEKYIDLVFS